MLETPTKGFRASASPDGGPQSGDEQGAVARVPLVRRYRWPFAAAVAVLVAAGTVGVVIASSRGGVVPLPGTENHKPLGVPGSWVEVWGDEFDGTAIDTTRWSTEDGQRMNNVTAHTSNVTVADGNLILTLASETSGAFVSSHPVSGTLTNGYELPVGAYVEARVLFPGDGTAISNWPAWWVSGSKNWPKSGEHDIAEGLGTLTVNYHSGSGPHNFGTVSGVWSNEFHTYGLYRGEDHADVYWDGKLVRSYPSDDTGAGQSLIFNVGAGSPNHEDNGSLPVYGTGSQVKVDYVRAYEPAG